MVPTINKFTNTARLAARRLAILTESRVANSCSFWVCRKHHRELEFNENFACNSSYVFSTWHFPENFLIRFLYYK